MYVSENKMTVNLYDVHRKSMISVRPVSVGSDLLISRKSDIAPAIITSFLSLSSSSFFKQSLDKRYLSKLYIEHT